MRGLELLHQKLNIHKKTSRLLEELSWLLTTYTHARRGGITKIGRVGSKKQDLKKCCIDGLTILEASSKCNL